MRRARPWIWVVAAAVEAAALWAAHGAALAVAALALAPLLVLLTMRPKAPAEPGALWSAAADLLDGRHKRPGQLSLMPGDLVWKPSRYSRRHGFGEIRLSAAGAEFTLTRGPALLDATLTAVSPSGSYTFGTRRSRHLDDAVARLAGTGRRPGS